MLASVSWVWLLCQHGKLQVVHYKGNLFAVRVNVVISVMLVCCIMLCRWCYCVAPCVMCVSVTQSMCFHEVILDWFVGRFWVVQCVLSHRWVVCLSSLWWHLCVWNRVHCIGHDDLDCSSGVSRNTVRLLMSSILLGSRSWLRLLLCPISSISPGSRGGVVDCLGCWR